MKNRPTPIPLLISIFVASAFLTVMLPAPIYAFHEGGEVFCEGCHVMEAFGNTDFPPLKGFDTSSTCLRCHAQAGKFYNVLSNSGSTYTAGGDFHWLRNTFTWSSQGRLLQSTGDSHGHNVIAVEYGLRGEGTLSSAPGGVYPAGTLGCTSCHDPHARSCDSEKPDGIPSSISLEDALPMNQNDCNYRLLGGVGYRGGTLGGGFTFRYPAPVAKANPADWIETDSNHTAYGSGMSEWCSNCHQDFLNGNNSHRSGANAARAKIRCTLGWTPLSRN